MNSKGFTLVEVLAVLIILAILLTVAVPIMNNLIDNKTKDTFLINAKTLIRQIKYENKEFTSSTINALGLAEIDFKDYDKNASMAYQQGDEIYLNLVGTGQYEGMYLCWVSLETNTANVQTTACPAPTYYTVTFNANGGTVGTSSMQIIPGTNYGTLPTPTRAGYKFLGWNGKNMLNLEVNKQNPSNIGYSNSTKRTFTPNTYNLGLTDSNYYNLANIYNVVINQNSVFLHAQGGYCIGFPYTSLQSKTITISYDLVSNVGTYYGDYSTFYAEDGSYIGKLGVDRINGTGHYSRTISIDSTYYYVNLMLCGSSTGNGATFSNIQLEESPTATEYEPYYVTSGTTVTQAKNHTLTAKWEAL